MAKLSAYQQQRLASSVINPGGLDTSGLQIAHAMSGSANALASDVGQAQANSQNQLNQLMASSIGNFGNAINNGIRNENRRKAEIASEMERLEKEKQGYRDAVFEANTQVKLSEMLDEHAQATEDEFKFKDPKQASKAFAGSASKKLEDFFKQYPELANNDKVKTGLTIFANQQITQHRRSLKAFGEKQADVNNVLATNATTDDIVAGAGVKAPKGVNPIGESALLYGQENLINRIPVHAVSEGGTQADITIKSKRVEHFNNWANANISNSKDLRLMQDWLEPTQRNGGVPKVSSLQGIVIPQKDIDSLKSKMDARVKAYDVRLQKDEQIMTTGDKLDVSNLVAPIKYDVDGVYTPEDLAPVLNSLMAGRKAVEQRPREIRGVMGDRLNNPTIQPALDEYDSAIVLVKTKISDYKKNQDAAAKQSLVNAQSTQKAIREMAWESYSSSPKAQQYLMAVNTLFTQLSGMKTDGENADSSANILKTINAADLALKEAMPFMRDKDTGRPNSDYIQKQSLLRVKLNAVKDMTQGQNIWINENGKREPVDKRIEAQSMYLNSGATAAAKSWFPLEQHAAVDAHVNNSVAKMKAEFKKVSGFEPDEHTLSKMVGIANVNTASLPRTIGKASKADTKLLEESRKNYEAFQKGARVPPPPKTMQSVQDMLYLKPGLSKDKIAKARELGLID